MPALISMVTFVSAALIACGPVTTPAGSRPSGVATNGPVPSGERATLTDIDSGTTVNVRVGAVITVQLAVASGYRWSPPSATNPAVVAVVATAQLPDGSASATLRALMPGTAELSATGDPTCYPACKRLSRIWQVTIVVTPHPVP
jgi:hypothetical protein